MRVAVVGIGSMGAAIARLLLERGDEVTVWNRSAAAAARLGDEGARVAATLADAWNGAQVALVLLADDGAVESVLAGPAGLFASAPPGACVVEMSTISPVSSARIAKAAGAAGVAYVRGPVSGNPSVVAAGQLTVMASGPPDAIDRARPVLDTIAARTIVVGSAEEARVAKLATNLVLAGTNQLLAEAVVLGEVSGLRREDLLSVLESSAVGSRFVSYKGAALAARDYRPSFTVDLLRKDLRLVAETAAAGGVELPVADAVSAAADAAAAAGYGARDLGAVLPALQVANAIPPDVRGE